MTRVFQPMAWTPAYFKAAQAATPRAGVVRRFVRPASAIAGQRRGMATRQDVTPDYYVGSEFGKLTSVLVGRADGFRLPAHEHEPLLYERNVHGEYNHVGAPYPDDVIVEASASLEGLCEKLEAWDPEIESDQKAITMSRSQSIWSQSNF